MSAVSLGRKSSLKSPFNSSFTKNNSSFRANHVRFNLNGGDSVLKEKENESFCRSPPQVDSARHPTYVVQTRLANGLHEPAASCETNEVTSNFEAERGMANSSAFRFGSNQPAEFTFRQESPFLPHHFLPASVADHSHVSRIARRNALRSQESIANANVPVNSLNQSGIDLDPAGSAPGYNRRLSSGSFSNRHLKLGVPTISLTDSPHRAQTSAAGASSGSPIREYPASTNSPFAPFARPLAPTFNESLSSPADTSPTKANSSLHAAPATSAAATSPKRFAELLNVAPNRASLNATDSANFASADLLAPFGSGAAFAFNAHSNLHLFPSQTQAQLQSQRIPLSPTVSGGPDPMASFASVANSRLNSASRWITVFGYPSEFDEVVLQEFGTLGRIDRVVASRLSPTSQSHALHLRYCSEADSTNAVRRNGALLRCGAATFRVGVCECVEPIDDGSANDEAQTSWWQDANETCARPPVSPRKTVLNAVRSGRSALRPGDSAVIRNLALHGTGSTSSQSTSFVASSSLNGSLAAQSADVSFSNATFNDSRVRLGKRNAAWLMSNGERDGLGVPRKRSGFLSKALDYVFGK